MEEQQTNWRQIRLFAIVTVLLTAGGYVPLAITGETNVFLLAAPAVAAIVTKLIAQRNLRGCLRGYRVRRSTSVAIKLFFDPAIRSPSK